MAGKSDVFEADILKLVLNGTPIANLADNAASSPLGNLYLALHTADPLAGTTESGTQSTSETTYTGYARMPVVRSNASPAWTVATDAAGLTKATLNAAVSFALCTAGSVQTITHFSVGTLSTGAGKILYAGPVTTTIPVQAGIQPVLGTATAIQED